MALILCHQCLSWVEPLGDQCPQCDFPVDIRAPDPSRVELRASIGNLRGTIGEVRLVRTGLPDRGLLYETSHGILFVPQRLEQVRVVSGKPRRSLRGILAAWLRAPLTFSGIDGQSRPAQRMEIAYDDARPLNPGDSERLPALLMQNPGVFFLSWNSIQHMRKTLWGWTITRLNDLTLRIKPLGDRNTFSERMTALAAETHEAVCS